MANQLYTSSAPPPARTITLAGPGGTIELDRKTIEVLAMFAVGALDLADGDPDLEDGTNIEDEGIQPLLATGAGCEVSDPNSPSTPEWHTLGRFKGRVPSESLPHKDVEQDDEPEDDTSDSCCAGEDRGSAEGGDDGQPGDAADAEQEHDNELEQMGNDVPCLPVYSIRENLFTDEREYLGLNNLQPSFVGSGDQVKSAN